MSSRGWILVVWRVFLEKKNLQSHCYEGEGDFIEIIVQSALENADHSANIIDDNTALEESEGKSSGNPASLQSGREDNWIGFAKALIA